VFDNDEASNSVDADARTHHALSIPPLQPPTTHPLTTQPNIPQSIVSPAAQFTFNTAVAMNSQLHPFATPSVPQSATSIGHLMHGWGLQSGRAPASSLIRGSISPMYVHLGGDYGNGHVYLPRLMSPLSILYCHLVTLHALDFAQSCETLYLILYVDYAWSV